MWFYIGKNFRWLWLCTCISNNNNITANISWINAILHWVLIVGFVKDDLSRVMGILGRCKFAGETFHGFCEAPGGFSFSALIWYWGSIRFNSVYLWFGRFADDNFTRSEMPHSGNQPIQVSGKESVTLLGQLLNLQQGVDVSLRKSIQVSCKVSATRFEQLSNLQQWVDDSLWKSIQVSGKGSLTL